MKKLTPSPYQPNFNKQRGMSLLILLFWVTIFGSLFLLATKCVPPVFEYYEVKKSLATAAKEGGDTNSIINSFNKSVQAGYVDSVSSKDLTINNNEGVTTVSFAYDKTIHIAGPVNILFKFSGKELVRQ